MCNCTVIRYSHPDLKQSRHAVIGASRQELEDCMKTVWVTQTHTQTHTYIYIFDTHTILQVAMVTNVDALVNSISYSKLRNEWPEQHAVLHSGHRKKSFYLGVGWAWESYPHLILQHLRNSVLKIDNDQIAHSREFDYINNANVCWMIDFTVISFPRRLVGRQMTEQTRVWKRIM